MAVGAKFQKLVATLLKQFEIFNLSPAKPLDPKMLKIVRKRLFARPSTHAELVRSRKSDGKVKSSSLPVRHSLWAKGEGVANPCDERYMSVRRNHNRMKRNTEIGLFPKPSIIRLLTKRGGLVKGKKYDSTNEPSGQENPEG